MATTIENRVQFACESYDVFKSLRSLSLNKDSQGVWSKEVNIEHRTHQSIGDLSRGYSWHILTSDIIWRSHYLFIAIHHFIFGSGSGWLTPGFCALCAFSSLAFPPAPQTSNAHVAAIEACSHRGEVLSREPQGPRHGDPQDTSRSFWAYAHQLELRLDPAPPIPLSRPASCSTLRKI